MKPNLNLGKTSDSLQKIFTTQKHQFEAFIRIEILSKTKEFTTQNVHITYIPAREKQSVRDSLPKKTTPRSFQYSIPNCSHAQPCYSHVTHAWQCMNHVWPMHGTATYSEI